jgi:glycosyltransferase involved in cell wall biosynthesis
MTPLAECPAVLDDVVESPPAQRRLHVAVIDEELPYPPVTGKRLRTFKLLIRLAGRHRVTYICHRNADRNEARLAAMMFADHKIETIVVDRAVPAKAGPAFYGRLAANLFSGLPYSVATHRSQALSQAIEAYAASQPIDLWQCEWTPYAMSLAGRRGVNHLIVAHNVESQIWQRYYETEVNPLKRWYIKQQVAKWRKFERWAFARANGLVAVSAEDGERIRRDFGCGRVDVVDNGVDTDYFRPLSDHRDPRRVLFLGSLDWRPNLDAVCLLLEKVFPVVWQAEPRARLIIAGRNPPASLRRRVAGLERVELHANVPDVRPYLAQCGLMAVPLRIGGGSRLKILEALATGMPVVSTRIGAEGLRLEADEHLKVVDHIDDIAGAILWTMKHSALARAAAERARLAVLERYDWGILANKLEQVWLRCARRAPSATALARPGRYLRVRGTE